MAYRRRYLSGQAATTVVIAEGAITSDKIVDGAVTHPKLAPGSVDSERVIDSSLKSEDIKDGEIKSVDIASGAITTDKIASQAVTVDKLEASIQGIARPLTPGVSTSEILDDAVTEPKLGTNSVGSDALKPGAVGESELAGNAVVEGKIKDGEISTSKYKPSSVDSVALAANSVTGTEILAGACGETELGADSVVTSKVKAANITLAKMAPLSVDTPQLVADAVTEPKLDVAALARRHIESKDTRVLTHFEEFNGLDISNKWAKKGHAGGIVYNDGDKGLNIKTGAVANNKQWIDWGDKWLGLATVVKPLVNIWISSRGTPITYFSSRCGLWFDALDNIIFYAKDIAGAVPNWQAECRKNGAATTVDTLIAVTDDIQLLSIDVISAASVKFYIDGIEVAEITTNIPDDQTVQPYLEIEAESGAIRNFWVKYFSILAERPAYA